MVLFKWISNNYDKRGAVVRSSTILDDHSAFYLVLLSLCRLELHLLLAFLPFSVLTSESVLEFAPWLDPCLVLSDLKYVYFYLYFQ
mmetsp:Transcript_35054/g.36461  ORF Transcript_35054/g.36461 Transcript_35054/m.36461 type:complete len:86 (+) Transcript_35054:7-264(+)